MNLSKLTVYAKFLVAAAGVVAIVVQQVVTNGWAHIDYGPIIPAAAAALAVLSVPNAQAIVTTVADQVKAAAQVWQSIVEAVNGAPAPGALGNTNPAAATTTTTVTVGAASTPA